MNQDFRNKEWIRLLKTRIESEDIRVLTLWQPWASMIPFGLKQFETRGWATKYRGKILIHAAQRKPNKNDADAWAKALRLGNIDPRSPLKRIDASNVGAILAIADLTDCKIMDSELIAEQSELELAVGDWQVGRYAWQLKNIIAAPVLVPYKNGQGLQRLKVERLP